MDIENGHIFGTSVRKDVRDLMGVPGPGQYNAFSGLNHGGASMKAKTSYGGFIQVKDTPGPGQYNPDSRKGQGCKIGTSQRSDFTGGIKYATPGPGQHNSTEYDIQSRAGKGSKFGYHNTGVVQDRSKGLVTNAKNPGPGAYSYGYSQGGPAYSMGAKVSDNLDSWQPGPGRYQPDIQSVKGDPKSGKFGAGNRSNIAQGKFGPGPGAYN